MRLLRIRSLCWFATLVVHAISITLLGVLQSYPELRDLYRSVNASSNATSLLASANNFTFFAPNNNAIQSAINENPDVLTDGSFEAILQYSLLKGGYPTLSFSNVSQFVSSNLINSTYSNVTDGQAVELLKGENGRPEVVTGNKSISTSPSTEIICTGGIVHIVDAVFSLPAPTVLEITSAHLEYLISILSLGGYLNSSNAGYVNGVLELPDVTYFLPNSAGALANATELISKNSSTEELQALFQYHIVPGFVGYSSRLKNGMLLKTAQGEDVNITRQDNELYVNAAKIIATDYIVANGVVHVIEDLLDRFDKAPPPPPVSKTSTVSTSSPTASSTSTSNKNEPTSGVASASPVPAGSSNSKGGLSQGAKIGIGVGVSVGGLLVLAAIGGFLLRSKKRKREESGIWDNQDMSGVTNDMGKFYVRRGTVHRQEDLGLGLHDTGNHGSTRGTHPEDIVTSPPYSALPSGQQPNIPPRSPGRTMSRNEF